ncbi:MAG: adenylate/guanylate cyclase domain-containing protein [Spirulina sp. SIO3F2]|nr:adenylate/guanylate cyclase domain-containing protein [Spirulina sp. SIO3F2]
MGVAIGLWLSLLPLHAQPQRLPTASTLALSQDWQYHWDQQLQSPERPPPLNQWLTLDIPQRLEVKAGYPVLWLALPLPTGNWQTPTLYIQGIPNILEAYIDDEVVYTLQQLDRHGQPLHNEGAFPLVALRPDQVGQTLTLRIYIGQDKVIPLGYGGVPQLGEQGNLFRALIVQDSPRLILGFLFLFCGLFPLIIAFWRTTGISYISFGCVAFLIGIYTITPAQIIRLLFDYSIVWTYVHHITFHILPISICIFFEHVFGAGPKRIVRRLWQVHLFAGPLAILLAGSQVLTWAEAAVPTQLLDLISASVLIGLSWAIAARGNPEAKIFAWGFSLFLGFAVYDLIVYIAPQTLWSFQLYIWGMLVFLICLAFILERQFTEAQNHLKAYNKASDRFIPHEFLTLLGKKSIIDVGLGDQVHQEMTVLFSDIRAFTSLSETMTPERNFNFLNAYLECVSPVIREHNGFIDKYIGDAIMALFPHSAEDAIQAAIAMQKQLAAFNQRIIHQGYPSINIGIGLHQGAVMLGTIGESQRMETTVIADAVNLASRLEDSTKQYGAALIVSQNTLENLPNSEQFEHRFLGKIYVKGKKEPIRICEVYSADPDTLRAFKTQTRDRFEAAIGQYDRGDRAGAQVIFEQLWHENPEDKVTRLCLLRCKAL